MVLSSLTNALLALWRRARLRVSNRHLPLRVEELELRCVPAYFLWGWGGGGAGNWSQAGNWLEQQKDGSWKYTDNIPGVNDDVMFAATFQGFKFNTNCVVNTAVTVHSVYIGYGYSAELELLNPLMVSGSDGDSRFFLSSGAKISGLGAQAGKAQIILAGGSGLNWSSGTLQSLEVDVQRTATANAFLRIVANAPNTPGPKIGGVTLNVSGELDWVGSDVQDYQWPSLIHISSGGVFNITDAGNTFGANAASDPSLLRIKNDTGGLVQVNSSGTAAFIGKYTSEGTTQLQGGTLYIAGLAEQLKGQFILAGGSITIANGTTPQGLRITDRPEYHPH